MTPEQIEREREAFEAWAAGEGFATALTTEDAMHGGEYDTYDTSCAWQGWLARVQSERVVGVGELEALCHDWEERKVKLSAQSYDLGEQDGVRSAAYDLRAIIAKAEVGHD